MKISRLFPAVLIAVAIFCSGCGTKYGKEATLVGHFSYLDTSKPHCGFKAWASKSIFIVDATGEKIDVAIPCIEMEWVEDGKSPQTLLKTGDHYQILVKRERFAPDLDSPYILDRNPLFLYRVTKQP